MLVSTVDGGLRGRGLGLRIEKGNLMRERKKPGKNAEAKRTRNRRCKTEELEALVGAEGIENGNVLEASWRGSTSSAVRLNSPPATAVPEPWVNTKPSRSVAE